MNFITKYDEIIEQIKTVFVYIRLKLMLFHVRNQTMIRISLFILLFFTALFAERDVKPVIEVDSNSYGVEYSFETTLPDEQLYQIFFKYSHVQNYMQKTILTIDLLNEDESANRINFHYNYLIANLDMQINRFIDRADREVEFKMHSYSRSGKILPDVKETNGHYAIREINGKKTIHYAQNTTLGVEISRLYRKMILRENRKYLESLIEYVREQEEKQAQNPTVAFTD